MKLLSWSLLDDAQAEDEDAMEDGAFDFLAQNEIPDQQLLGDEEDLCYCSLFGVHLPLVMNPKQLKHGLWH